MKLRTLALPVFLALGLGSSALAQDLKVSGSTVGIALPGAALATLTVAGPNGFRMQNSSRSGSVALQLATAGPLPDGAYTYEVSAATSQMVPNRNTLDNGRGKEPSMIHVGATQSGTFVVKGGAIVLPRESSNSDNDG